MRVPPITTVPMLLPSWMDPDTLINGLLDQFGTWAVAGIALIVIIETGLLFPLLPGDSLLFTVGLFVGTGAIDMPLWLVCLILFLAAFVGDQMGYAIGHFAGPKIFDRPNSKIFNQQQIARTHAFFERYGGRALILGRFVPFVRTYIPVAAGIGKMPYRHFISYNAIGAFAWGVGVTLLGYWLGGFAIVRDNIEVALILIVAVSLLPIAIEWFNARRQAKRAPESPATPAE